MNQSATRMLIHVPHASTVIPSEVRPQFSISDAELERELLALTDRYTDDLFSFPAESATTIEFPISRFVVDPERFEDDAQESMAARGMGVIYMQGSAGQPIRHTLPSQDREALLETWYRPHWKRVEYAVDQALNAHGECLIVDAHSFPDRPLPVHQSQYGASPTRDICLGTDSFHTSKALVETAAAAFESHGLTVSVDNPFAGTIVPLKHLNTNDGVQSIMIEVNRRMYMNERTGEKTRSYQQVKSAMHSALLKLSSAEV